MTFTPLTGILIGSVLALHCAMGLAAGADHANADVSRDHSQPALLVEMRAAARVAGEEVRVGDVAILRSDGKFIDQLQQAVIYHRRELEQGEGAASVDVQNVMRVLLDAGVNAGRVHVRGPIACEVFFVDQPSGQPADEDDSALLAWAGVEAEATPSKSRGEDAAAAAWELDELEPRNRSVGLDSHALADTAHLDSAAPATLGERLRLDLAERLGLEAEQLRLVFRAQDAPVVERRDLPLWSAAPQRAADLGRVSWRVQVDGRVMMLQADASARVTRAVLVRPVARGQVLRPEDLDEQEAVITRLTERGLEVAEAVGQQAARAMSMGEVVSADRLSPQLAARRGQVLTVLLTRNGVEVRTLARALEDGAFGQSIRARNEVTGQEVHVTLTGPQIATLAEAP